MWPIKFNNKMFVSKLWCVYLRMNINTYYDIKQSFIILIIIVMMTNDAWVLEMKTESDWWNRAQWRNGNTNLSSQSFPRAFGA
jgi:hypothetical protein